MQIQSIEEGFVEQSLNAWLLPAFCLAIGVVIGILIARLLPGSGSSNARNKMDEMQQRFENYQNDVVDHFSATAGLVQRLNQSYQDILNHLSEGANKLAPDDATRQRLLTSLSEPSNTPAPRLADGSEPPRDYAPGAGGTLSEEFSAHNAPKEQKD